MNEIYIRKINLLVHILNWLLYRTFKADPSCTVKKTISYLAKTNINIILSSKPKEEFY